MRPPAHLPRRSLNTGLTDALRAALACGEPAADQMDGALDEQAAALSTDGTTSTPSDFLEAAAEQATAEQATDDEVPIEGSEAAAPAADMGLVDASAAELIEGSEAALDSASVDAAAPIEGAEAAPQRRRRLMLH